jgi:hypothetical protein
MSKLLSAQSLGQLALASSTLFKLLAPLISFIFL